MNKRYEVWYYCDREGEDYQSREHAKTKEEAEEIADDLKSDGYIIVRIDEIRI